MFDLTLQETLTLLSMTTFAAALLYGLYLTVRQKDDEKHH